MCSWPKKGNLNFRWAKRVAIQSRIDKIITDRIQDAISCAQPDKLKGIEAYIDEGLIRIQENHVRLMFDRLLAYHGNTVDPLNNSDPVVQNQINCLKKVIEWWRTQNPNCSVDRIYSNREIDPITICRWLGNPPLLFDYLNLDLKLPHQDDTVPYVELCHLPYTRVVDYYAKKRPDLLLVQNQDGLSFLSCLMAEGNQVVLRFIYSPAFETNSPELHQIINDYVSKKYDETVPSVHFIMEAILYHQPKCIKSILAQVSSLENLGINLTTIGLLIQFAEDCDQKFAEDCDQKETKDRRECAPIFKLIEKDLGFSPST